MPANSLSTRCTVAFLRGIIFLTLVSGSTAWCGPLRDRLEERRQERAGRSETRDNMLRHDELPAGARAIRDLAYGRAPGQSMDVYLPPAAARRGELPVLMMVHGGAWKSGDKRSGALLENKLKRWLPQGIIFISVNYRLWPAATPRQQAADVALALASAQSRAAEWGGDRQKFILMGHSAGAHLVALLASDPGLAAQSGASPWLGTIALDSAGYDIGRIMETRHYRFYDEVFGNNPADWDASSPLLQLRQPGAPFLAVCSSQRPDRPCDQAGDFVAKAHSLGMHAELLPQALSHAEINQELGLESDYTLAVERFMAGLHKRVRQSLAEVAK